MRLPLKFHFFDLCSAANGIQTSQKKGGPSACRRSSKQNLRGQSDGGRKIDPARGSLLHTPSPGDSLPRQKRRQDQIGPASAHSAVLIRAARESASDRLKMRYLRSDPGHFHLSYRFIASSVHAKCRSSGKIRERRSGALLLSDVFDLPVDGLYAVFFEKMVGL